MSKLSISMTTGNIRETWMSNLAAIGSVSQALIRKDGLQENFIKETIWDSNSLMTKILNCLELLREERSIFQIFVIMIFFVTSVISIHYITLNWVKEVKTKVLTWLRNFSTLVSQFIGDKDLKTHLLL